MHHTYSYIDSILWTVKVNFLFINKNLSACRLIQTTEHIHHSTLTCTIFPKDSMYLSLVYCQVNVVICNKGSKLFDDVLHLDYNLALIHMTCFCHSLIPPVVLYIYDIVKSLFSQNICKKIQIFLIRYLIVRILLSNPHRSVCDNFNSYISIA